jgi:hypothetical protein
MSQSSEQSSCTPGRLLALPSELLISIANDLEDDFASLRHFSNTCTRAWAVATGARKQWLILSTCQEWSERVLETMWCCMNQPVDYACKLHRSQRRLGFRCGVTYGEPELIAAARRISNLSEAYGASSGPVWPSITRVYWEQAVSRQTAKDKERWIDNVLYLSISITRTYKPIRVNLEETPGVSPQSLLCTHEGWGRWSVVYSGEDVQGIEAGEEIRLHMDMLQNGTRLELCSSGGSGSRLDTMEWKCLTESSPCDDWGLASIVIHHATDAEFHAISDCLAEDLSSSSHKRTATSGAKWIPTDS